MAESDLGNAAAAESWPVLGDRSVIVDSAALGEEVDGSGDHAYATREAHEQRIAIDWPLITGVGQARSGVEHNLHGGNHGGRGLQVDSTTPRTTKQARWLSVGHPLNGSWAGAEAVG